MARRPEPDEDGLVHVVVCGGTPSEWLVMTPTDWNERLARISAGVADVGARWVTVRPHRGGAMTDAEASVFRTVMESTDGVERLGTRGIERYVRRGTSGPSVVVDASADGHGRFAAVVDSMRAAGEEITEEALSSALLEPVRAEPDLVLILGPPDELPTSLVWELAYSELVFLDIKWADLQAGHLEMAVDDFNRRLRRFGGLDS